MSDFATAACEAFGADRVGRGRSAGAVHDVSRRRTGRLARRDARRSDEIVAALQLARAAGVPVTLLGGGSNVLISDAGVRGLVIRPRGGAIRSARRDHVRADAAVTINGLVRWTILHGCGGPRSLGRHAGHGRRRHLRQRAFRRPADRRLVDRGAARDRDGDVDDVPASRRWRSATIAADCSTPARCCCRRVPRRARRSGRRCARRRASRWRIASARSRSTRRAPAASFRTRSRAAIACPTASRGRPARWSIAPG